MDSKVCLLVRTTAIHDLSSAHINTPDYNEGLVGHPMHLHRQPHIVIAKDGFALNSPYQVDTLWVAPGERYTVLIKASEVGTWAFHCHILNHAESDTGLMGMVTAMVVTDPDADKAS